MKKVYKSKTTGIILLFSSIFIGGLSIVAFLEMQFNSIFNAIVYIPFTILLFLLIWCSIVIFRRGVDYLKSGNDWALKIDKSYIEIKSPLKNYDLKRSINEIVEIEFFESVEESEMGDAWAIVFENGEPYPMPGEFPFSIHDISLKLQELNESIVCKKVKTRMKNKKVGESYYKNI